MKFNPLSAMAIAVLILCTTTSASHAAGDPQAKIKTTVDRTIQPVMAKYRIPGMTVGVISDGKTYVFNYGVMSKQTSKPVTNDTLFEVGSISKTFTATLASEAQILGDLSLSDPVSKYLPILRGSKFGGVSLLNLGTHTPGGLPLQVPGSIHDNDQLMQYFKQWKPTYAPGTYRTYGNPGIGTLGLITAKSMGKNFSALVEQGLFPALGMPNSFIDVPAARWSDYAEGYSEDGAPVRMKPDVLSSEAGAIKTTATDLIRYMQANMGLIELDGKLQQAIKQTHTGYFKAGGMIQDLAWEQYPYPVALKTLLDGNSPHMIFDATPVTAITPPQQPRADVWINKTGSTNGFGAYIAFVPNKQFGIVILANRNYPIEQRVTAAYQIMTALTGEQH